MIAAFIKRALGLSLLVLLPTLSYAEVPSGYYETYFDQLETDIWDLSGYYHGSIYFNEHDNDVDFWLSQGDDGKITGGDGKLWVWNEWPVDFSLSGAIERIRGDIPRVVLRTKIKEKINFGDDEDPDWWKISGPIRYTAVIDTPSNSLTGTVRGTLCLTYLEDGEKDCSPIDEAPLYFSFPAEANGSWGLVLDIQNVNGKKLRGTAEAILYTETDPNTVRRIFFTLKGKYNASTDLAKLTLKGSGGKLTIQAYAESPYLYPLTIKGKMMGQTIEANINY